MGWPAVELVGPVPQAVFQPEGEAGVAAAGTGSALPQMLGPVPGDRKERQEQTQAGNQVIPI